MRFCLQLAQRLLPGRSDMTFCDYARRLAVPLTFCVVLTGCERLNEIANQAKLNGRAIGAACRHSGRALEDCFQRNPRVPKADIYAGWREMNEYMTAKKLDV